MVAGGGQVLERVSSVAVIVGGTFCMVVVVVMVIGKMICTLTILDPG